MPIAEVLRHRIRYFTDGVVLGSVGFVNSVFERVRHKFGPKRQDGAGSGLSNRRDRTIRLSDCSPSSDLSILPNLER